MTDRPDTPPAPEFGTSGLRGLSSALTDTLCARYTRAFLSGGDHDGLVLIGGDLRKSTPRIMQAVARGARSLGLQVRMCGTLPTPALALAASAARAPAIMVTGSHIPADRNGLKFYTRAGELTKAGEQGILARLEPSLAPGILDAAAPQDAPEDAAAPAIAAYRQRYEAHFGPAALSGMTIGVYEHSSVARDLLHDVLRALGARTIPLGRSADFVPVDTEAVPDETRAALAAWAEERPLDAIVSTDGDADRPLVADAAGKVVPGDILGALTARRLGATHLVTPVSSNGMIEEMPDFAGIARTRIGSPYVIEAMEEARRQGHAVAGYEANGGFLLGFEALSRNGGAALAPLMTRDCLLPILAVLAAAAEARGSLAALVADLPPRRTASDRLKDVPTARSKALVETLTRDAQARDALLGNLGRVVRIDLTDGLRMHLESGRTVHLRPSGNAPELRCYAEARDAQSARQAVHDLLNSVKRRLEQPDGG